MKNKITIKVCGESKTDNLIVSKYLTHLLRILNFKVFNIDYIKNDIDPNYLAKHMEKLLKRNVHINVEIDNDSLLKIITEDQFSEIFPDKSITNPSVKKNKKNKSVTDYPSDFNC